MYNAAVYTGNDGLVQYAQVILDLYGVQRRKFTSLQHGEQYCIRSMKSFLKVGYCGACVEKSHLLRSQAVTEL